MKAKILTRAQAIKLGLAKEGKQGRSGGGGGGGGAIVKVNSAGKETVLESFRDNLDGTKEITFMSKERRKYLKDTNDYVNYIKTFDKIEGKDIKEELKLLEKK